jgi:hypothetical protein
VEALDGEHLAWGGVEGLVLEVELKPVAGVAVVGAVVLREKPRAPLDGFREFRGRSLAELRLLVSVP